MEFKFDINKVHQDEYEMEYYNMHSLAIYDCIYDNVMFNINKECSKLTNSLEKSIQNKELLEKINVELEKTYKNAATPHLIKIKEKISNWLKIPDNILVPKDAEQAVQYTDSNIDYYKNENKALRTKLRKEQMFEAALKQELDRLNKASELYENNSLLDTVEKYLENSSWINNDNYTYLQSIKSNIEKSEHLVPKQEEDIYNPNIDHLTLKKFDYDTLPDTSDKP